jgi:hypothetical protein
VARLAAALLAMSVLVVTAADARAAIENRCIPQLKLTSGWCGDGGPATQALMWWPQSVETLPDGSFLFNDSDVRLAVVRRVAPDGTITREAGTGVPGFSGDGGPAKRARFGHALSFAALPDGSYLIPDTDHQRVRRVDRSGIVETVAGTGRAGFSGDGGRATAASLSGPTAVAATAEGGFLIADAGNHRVRRVDAAGIITTVAGTGRPGFRGDGGPAALARLGTLTDIKALPGGGYALVEQFENPVTFRTSSRLRRISPTGTISTVATAGMGDFNRLAGVPDGSFRVTVTGENQILRISPGGATAAVAGMGDCGYSGDNGPALSARLALPQGLASLPNGGFLVADGPNSRIRRVSANGIITTVAGGGGLSRPENPNPKCGASPKYGGINGFAISGARAHRSGVRVSFYLTLRARVSVVLKRGRRVVARRGARSVVAGRRKVAVRRRLGAGRYRVQLVASRKGVGRARDSKLVRVRR